MDAPPPPTHVLAGGCLIHPGASSDPLRSGAHAHLVRRHAHARCGARAEGRRACGHRGKGGGGADEDSSDSRAGGHGDAVLCEKRLGCVPLEIKTRLVPTSSPICGSEKDTNHRICEKTRFKTRIPSPPFRRDALQKDSRRLFVEPIIKRTTMRAAALSLLFRGRLTVRLGLVLLLVALAPHVARSRPLPPPKQRRPWVRSTWGLETRAGSTRQRVGRAS